MGHPEIRQADPVQQGGGNALLHPRRRPATARKPRLHQAEILCAPACAAWSSTEEPGPGGSRIRTLQTVRQRRSARGRRALRQPTERERSHHRAERYPAERG